MRVKSPTQIYAKSASHAKRIARALNARSFMVGSIRRNVYSSTSFVTVFGSSLDRKNAIRVASRVR